MWILVSMYIGFPLFFLVYPVTLLTLFFVLLLYYFKWDFWHLLGQVPHSVFFHQQIVGYSWPWPSHGIFSKYGRVLQELLLRLNSIYKLNWGRINIFIINTLKINNLPYDLSLLLTKQIFLWSYFVLSSWSFCKIYLFIVIKNTFVWYCIFLLFVLCAFSFYEVS